MSTINTPLRPPAVPLVVHDPYLSVWSMSDTLNSDWTRHWTGKLHTLCGFARIDGVPYLFMSHLTRHYEIDIALMTQTQLDVLPTRTIYQFEAAGVRLSITFMTPLLPDDLDVLSRPVTYLDLQAQALDGGTHHVSVYVDIGSNWVVNTPEQKVIWGRHRLNGDDALWMGSLDQALLEKAGDDVRIDWGYLYTAAPREQAPRRVLGGDIHLRRQFVASGNLPEDDDPNMPWRVGERPP